MREFYKNIDYKKLYEKHKIQDGDLLVIGETFIPYDFTNWRECTNYLLDKCYNMKRAMTFVEKDKEHLGMKCPLTGEHLTILASPEDLERIHHFFIVRNLYRRPKQ